MILNYTPKKPQTYRKTVRQNHDKIYKKKKTLVNWQIASQPNGNGCLIFRALGLPCHGANTEIRYLQSTIDNL